MRKLVAAAALRIQLLIGKWWWLIVWRAWEAVKVAVCNALLWFTNSIECNCALINEIFQTFVISVSNYFLSFEYNGHFEFELFLKTKNNSLSICINFHHSNLHSHLLYIVLKSKRENLSLFAYVNIIKIIIIAKKGPKYMIQEHAHIKLCNVNEKKSMFFHFLFFILSFTDASMNITEEICKVQKEKTAIITD